VSARPLVLGAVLVVGLLARLPGLGESLWYDEIWYTSSGMFRTPLLESFELDTHPPLYAIVARAWVALAGDGEISVRIPSLVFGLASIVMTWALARRWIGDAVALPAALLVALSPPHIWYSVEAKVNMLAVLLGLAVLWRAETAWRLRRRRDWVLLAVASIAALCTHMYSVWVVGTAFAWLGCQALRRERRSLVAPTLVTAFVVALGFVPVVIFFLGQLGDVTSGYLRPFTPGDLYKLFTVYLSHGNTLRTISPYSPAADALDQPWPLLLVDGAFLVWTTLGAWAVACRSTSRAHAELLGLALLLPILGIFVLSQVMEEVYIERNMLVLGPLLALVYAAGVMAIRRPALRVGALAVLVALNGVAVWNLWVAKADTWTVYKPNPDWRAAARHVVDARDASGTPTVVLTTIPPTALGYHLRRLGETFDERPGGPAPITVETATSDQQIVSELTSRGVDRGLLIENEVWAMGFDGLRTFLMADPRFEVEPTERFDHLQFYDLRLTGR